MQNDKINLRSSESALKIEIILCCVFWMFCIAAFELQLNRILQLAGLLLLGASTALLLIHQIRPVYYLKTLLMDANISGKRKEFFSSAQWKRYPFSEELSRTIDLMLQDETEKGKREIYEKQIIISALQSQINPHLLYNTLDCIRGQALLEDSTETAEMIAVLGEMFRYSVSRKAGAVKLCEELENLNNCIRIYRYRFQNRYSFKVTCENDALLNCYVPRLTLQPLLENAVVHGLESRKTGNVDIRIREEENMLIITVSDDGCGMDYDTLIKLNARISGKDEQAELETRTHGVALFNVNHRIHLLMGEQYGIQAFSEKDKGTDIEVIMPKLYLKEQLQ